LPSGNALFGGKGVDEEAGTDIGAAIGGACAGVGLGVSYRGRSGASGIGTAVTGSDDAATGFSSVPDAGADTTDPPPGPVDTVSDAGSAPIGAYTFMPTAGVASFATFSPDDNDDLFFS
jgi:hypothetical protein